jgi:hypothetical protein
MKTKIYAAYVATYDDYSNVTFFSADYFPTKEEAEDYVKERAKDWDKDYIEYEVEEVVIGGGGYGMEVSF